MAQVGGKSYPYLEAAPGVDLAHEDPTFLYNLNKLGAALNRKLSIFSGARLSGKKGTRWANVGFPGDPHDYSKGYADAADINIDGQPIGNFPGAVDTIHSLGLRSGATDFTYKGKTDPAHVDAVNTATTRTTTKNPPTANRDFAAAVLAAIGAPDTIGTRSVLDAMMQLENTNARFNPLATTQPAHGATDFNSTGVKNYPNFDTGVTATAQTLKNGNYQSLVAALQSGAPVTFGLTDGITKNLNTWGGWQPVDDRTKNSYATRVWLIAQGNPSGKSASDWTSTDSASGLANSVFDALGLGDVAKAILYATIIAGGGLMMVVGLVLIGVDLRGGSVPTPMSVATNRKTKREAGMSDAEKTDRAEAQRIYQEHRNTEAAEKARAAKKRADIAAAKATRERRQTRAGTPSAQRRKSEAASRKETKAGKDIFGAPL